MIITFNGNEGSGKSTISRMVAERLGYELLDGGIFFRAVAKKNKFTLTELRALRLQDPKWDFEIDNQIKELGKTRDDIIVGGRTAWHLIPHSLKIYLKVDEREAAERIYKELKKDQRRIVEEGKMDSVESIMESQRKRKEEDIEIYRKHYGVDIHDLKNYDVVIDTTGLSIGDVFAKVMEAVKKHEK